MAVLNTVGMPAILALAGIDARSASNMAAPNAAMTAQEWNLLRHEGRLWVVTPETVIDLGQAEAAMAAIRLFLGKDAEENRPGALAA